ncbi:Transthyretin-like family protein [Dictyocaulus viviparus]|uniref:Transthyretin-like family protein n=1 Tax=Dictyocaulus viviparus TaxID=29172 RepID=A0A0D8XKT1_DICVI|nr:Transthyretin-like family protein [Dictyocaulus viviparus]
MHQPISLWRLAEHFSTRPIPGKYSCPTQASNMFAHLADDFQQDPCQRRWKFELPNHYIARDNENKKIMDIGTWNLEALLPGESHDCLH